MISLATYSYIHDVYNYYAVEDLRYVYIIMSDVTIISYLYYLLNFELNFELNIEHNKLEKELPERKTGEKKAK